MRFAVALCCLLLCLLPASALRAQSSAPGNIAPAAAPSPLGDPATYVAQQFGTSFTVDAKVPPLFGDLDGDGNEDLVLVASSSTPLLAQQQFHFKAEDPYDAYFGTGNVKITSQFTLHFDGSSRCFLIVLGWRLPASQNSKKVSKFVLINTPFDVASIANFRVDKKTKRSVQAIETVDHTGTHALVLWDGKRWRWSAQGTEDDYLPKAGAQ